MKDWRNLAEYPGPDENNMRRWAWEFLRRNPEYQRDHAKMIQLAAKYGEPSSWDAHAETPAFYKLFLCEPPAKDGETESGWIKRVGKGRLQTAYAATAAKYHLSGYMPDPSTEWGETLALNFWPRGTGLTYHYRHHAETEMKITPPEPLEEALVRFDLTRPIKPQIEQAKRQLEAWQKKAYGKAITFRRWRRKLRDYLRVLDARSAGASYGEIAKVIYPGEEDVYPDYAASKKVAADAKKAQRLRDGDWITLLM